MEHIKTARMIKNNLPLGNDPASIRRRVEALELLLERSIIIPGTKTPIGLDAIVGLLPVAGDTIAGILGMYLVWEARNLGMSKWQLARMTGHVGFDWLLGLIPIGGDVIDFFYRSNTRNLKIIKRHLDKHHPGSKIIEG